MRKIHLIIMGMLTALLVSCENGDWDFPDYEYQTVYFSYQHPVRTITLGRHEVFDTSLDNQYQCQVLATFGGAYDNSEEVVVNFQIDESLLTDVYFDRNGNTDAQVLPLPEDYYSLSSDQIVIKKGQEIGGFTVQLTDAFFADPMALEANYVLPVVMYQVQNADSILEGRPLVENPHRLVATDWEVLPKDYVLYALRYVNPWHGYYLRRGEDVVTGKNGNSALDATVVRRKEFVEQDEVNLVETASLNAAYLDLTFKDAEGANIPCRLLLSFNQDGSCSISSATEGITASGEGAFVVEGEKNSWGSKDRDALYLDYEIDMDLMHVATTDTLVLRDRGVDAAFFTPVYKGN
ncbi:DUF5627 domain-containing protein [Geofilum rhodophaeum]|uniref:DUF5627 domain-containing protein n=1 Tax=Geofilum rhodophaeum TaxID=1965019 RepID=UPI000B523FD3|nr:DUF5627 domain-containing protein [Geofilum rhodophaeum]